MKNTQVGRGEKNVRLISALVLFVITAGLGQSNPAPQILPYTQNFGTAAFSSLPAGFGAWNGVSGASTTSQTAAEASIPTGNATVTAQTVKPQSPGGVYGYAANGNALIYLQGSGNVTNGVNQLMLAITTKGASAIKVNYTITMLSGSTNTAGIVLQCRAGSVGTWTSIANSVYQGNSTIRTTGQVDTYTDLSLPVAMENKDTVQLRWAFWRGTESGTVSSIGIDDISIFTGSGTSAPATPTLLSLADNSVNQQLSLQLTWNASSSATSYRLQVAANSAFTPVVEDSAGIAGLSITVAGLASNTAYYWRMSASNAVGSSMFSSARTFSTFWTIPPATPLGVSPANRSAGYSVHPLLSWNLTAGALTYRCQIAADSLFTTIVMEDSTITSTQFQAKGLTDTTRYWWRVRAKNTAGTSAFSGGWSFTTARTYLIPQQQLFTGVDVTKSLYDMIVSSYTPATVLDYSSAHEKLYGEIDKVADTIKCVYSGFACYMTPGVAPNTAASNGGINCEHSFPQSMGAGSGNGNSDMHHLYPANGTANSARSNWPFAEIPDANVTMWFRLGESRSTKPPGDLTEYSKFGTTTYEPRDAHKGHVARAIFYFYTIYRAECVAAGGDKFFEGMKATLLKWHSQFPVDSSEYARTLKIAVYQSGKANPFILDTTLVRRLYAPANVTDVASSGNVVPTAYVLEQNFPNPFNPSTMIRFSIPATQMVTLTVYDVLGRTVSTLLDGVTAKGSHSVSWNAATIPSGMYFYRLEAGHSLLTRKLVVQK